MAIIPPTICAPSIAEIPEVPAIAFILGTYAKLIPIIIGSFAPILKVLVPIPNNCRNVERAETTSDTCIIITLSASETPATFATIIAGVIQPTIIATTC